jgi:uncharacterized RDD family membrane protein YckC
MSTMSNPYAPPKAAVRDFTMSDAALVYADRGTRLGAAILDGIILAVMVYAPLILVGLGGALTGGSEDGDAAGSAGTLLMMAGVVLALAGFVAWCWLTVLYVNRNGQTIAKKWLKIKTVRSDGSPASLGRLFWLRNFV